MNLKQWGEQGIIDFITKKFSSPANVLGIGDDCSVIPIAPTKNLLITVDTLVENIHFLHLIDPKDLGYKSVMVNVSDVAAMGGKAKYLFLSLSLPVSLSPAWVTGFLEGFYEASEETKTWLLGGDTVGSSGPISVTVTAVGFSSKDHTKYRSHAQKGDFICVTGLLGASAAGLKLLLNPSLFLKRNKEDLIQAHVRPKAHFKQGVWLGTQKGVHAMMDISDGVALDLPRILRASACGGAIDLEALPIHPVVKQLGQQEDINIQQLALFGGEEYSLLLTIDKAEYKKINRKFIKKFKTPLYRIGHITNGEAIEYFDKEKKVSILDSGDGFSHF